MPRIDDLRQMTSEAGLTAAEKIVRKYLTPDQKQEAEREILTLSATDIKESLDALFTPQTLNLWLKALNFSNFAVFFNHPETKAMALDWAKEQKELKQIKAQYNLKTKQVSGVSLDVALLLDLIAPEFYQTELDKARHQLELVDESTDVEVNVILVQENLFTFEICLGQEENHAPTLPHTFLSKLTKPLQMSLMLGVLMSLPIESEAADKEAEALNYAKKAALAQADVQQTVETVKKVLLEKGKHLVNDYSLEVPAAVVGYGSQLAGEGNVKVQGSLKDVPVKYQMAVGRDVKFKLENGSNKDALYWLEGGKVGGEKKVELGVKFSF